MWIKMGRLEGLRIVLNLKIPNLYSPPGIAMEMKSGMLLHLDIHGGETKKKECTGLWWETLLEDREGEY